MGCGAGTHKSTHYATALNARPIYSRLPHSYRPHSLLQGLRHRPLHAHADGWLQLLVTTHRHRKFPA